MDGRIETVFTLYDVKGDRGLRLMPGCHGRGSFIYDFPLLIIIVGLIYSSRMFIHGGAEEDFG